MTRTRLSRLRPLISAVVAAATFAATFTPYFTTPAEAAAVSNYNLKIAVTYQGGSRPDSAVGEARPPLPAEPSDPNLTPPITPETEFVFEVLCTNSSVCNGADAPNRITWDFGDGHRKTAGTTVTHVYESPGVYTVRATAAQGTHYGEALRKVYVSPRWADIITVRGYDEVIRNDSPLLYWRLGETPGSSVVVDSSEQGNTGTLGGSPELGVAGAIASGTNTAVRLQNGDTISATNPIGGIMGNAPLTVEAWIRLEGSSADQEVLRLGSVSDDGALVISRTLADQIRVQVEGGGAVQAALRAGWNHIMVTWTPGVSGVLPGQLYVNGNQAGSITTGTLDLDGSFTIGGGFTGIVDEVVVYDRSLGAARAVARYQAGAEERISEARSDREAMWVAGALGLVDSCRTATRDDGADGVEVGRAMFCPEPRPSSALVTYLEANGPILIPKIDGRAVNGVTGEDCLAWWGACGLDKHYFASSIPATTSPEDVDVAGLEAAGKLDGDGSLIYDPRNCGDGWTMERSPSGAFELKPGVEDGCTSRAEWYEMLVRAVDGHLTRSPALRSGRWAEDPGICAEPAAQSFSYRRAAALGLTGVSGSEHPVGEPCGLDAAITKGEAMASLARALGVDPSQVDCSQTLRDLFDPSLGEWQEFQRVADPDCGLIDDGVLRGIPLVGDLNCHWEPEDGWDSESVGTCINPHDSLNRASSAALIAGVITEEGRGAGTLTLDLTQDGPKPVGTILTVVATGRAPLTTFGDFTFTFPNPPNANRLCSGTMVVPTHEYSGERRAVASCGYSFNAEVEVPLEVSIRDVYGNENSEMILISATNEAPDAPTPSTVGEFNEAPNASTSTIFTSYDINGQAVAFEVARNELNPYSGVNGPEGAYQVAVASDSPIAYWRLAEANGPVQDSAGSYHGSVVGDLNRSQSGALAEGNNPAYAFNGAGHVAVPNLPSAEAGKTTVELWMYWNGGSDDQVIAAFEDGQRLAIFDGFIGFVDGLEEETTGDGLFYAARTIGLSGQWTHVVAEFAPDMADNKLYLNGVEQNLEPLKNPVWVGDTSVGVGGPGLTLGAAPDGSHGFGGRLDEVAVYHGELNPTRRRIHQELGRRQVIAADENGRDMVRLEVEQLTANTARVIVRALTGDVNGKYSFLIRATDGDKASEPTLVEGIIEPVNDAPVVASGVISNTAIEGGPDVYGSLYGADPGDAGWAGPATSIVTYRITSGPAAGVLYYDSDSGPGTTWTEYNGGTVDTNNPVLRYTPDEGPYGDGYWGVTYQVLDTGYPSPGAWSTARTAYFYVINSNDPPVCLDVIAATDEDEPKTIWFNCADPEDDELEYEVITAPGHGTLTGDGASRTYTPNLNWCGEDSYTYRAFDGELYSGAQTVYVEVTCVNDAPTTPTPGLIPAFDENDSYVQTFTTTDVDGGPEWTFEVSADSETWSTTTQVTTSGGDSNGAVTITVNQGALDDKEASVTVSPAANICGDYVFYIRAYDGADYSEPGEVSGTINCLNNPPTTPSPSTMPTVNEDNSAVQTFTTTDSDGGPQWTFEVSNSPGSGFTTTSKAITGGTVSINQGSLTDKSASITFTPTANWCGNYTFYVRVFDGVDYSPVRTVTGTITCINDAPTTPTINSSWGTQYEDGGNIAVTHGSGATRAWERTYTTTDVDVNGTGSNRWCMQVRAWDGSWQPSSVSNCPSNTNTSDWVETAIARSGSTNYVWGLVQQGSLTDKTAKLRIIHRPNFDGNVSVSVRFCDDGGACSGAHTQTLSIKPYMDHVILVDYASGNFRWRESKPIGTGLSNSNQWAPANLNGTHRSQPVVGDWNGDGRDDRAVLHKSNSDITGTWVFNSEFEQSLPAYWEVPVPSPNQNDQNGRRGGEVRAFAGDWDGDGDDDYALWSNLSGRVWLLDNDTGAGTCWGRSVQPESTHWRGGCSSAPSDNSRMVRGQSPAGGDANGDGRDEVFLLDVFDNNGNNGWWQVRSSIDGAYVGTPPFSFGPKCDYKTETAADKNWMEHCFAVVGDWDGNGIETVGVFLRAPFGSHPINRFFWSNNFSGTLAGQHDFPNGSQQSTYMGVFGYDKP